MSRAMNVNLKEADVLAACTKQGVTVSASEPLPAGGTRVVLASSEGAEAMRAIFQPSMMAEGLRRTPFTVRETR